MAAHVLPRVTSDRPLRSPRGERELAVASTPSSTPALPSRSKGRDGVGPPQSVCFGLNPRCPLQETRSEPGRPSFNTNPQGD
eukprot:scaffold948_cov332-Pavlova_lutheri.AAC.2